jgi:hypothetical protein
MKELIKNCANTSLVNNSGETIVMAVIKYDRRVGN